MTGLQPLNVSALDVTPEDLDPGFRKHQMHTSDVVHNCTNVFLNVDLGQRGLGGDDSWGSVPYPQYCMPGNQTYSYSFVLTPVAPAE